MFRSDLFLTLMFHKISKDHRDGLTVTIDDFIRYINFFKSKDFKFLSAHEVEQILKKEKPEPETKSVFISFDDGYSETFKLLEENFLKYEVPITCFVPVAHVGGVNKWDDKQEPLLCWSEITRLADLGVCDFALHSYAHGNYKQMSLEEIAVDIQKCKSEWQGKKYFTPLLAYPYGAFKKDNKEGLAKTLKENGVVGAFRIGNRRNYWKSLSPYFIERIDIRGDQSFFRNILKFYF